MNHQLDTDDRTLAGILFDLADRRRRGESVDVQLAIQAHPKYAMELERLFPTIAALAELDAASARDGEAGHREPHDDVARTIGDYEIIREIGRGGMGIVYEARQISLNRRVALKMLPFAAALDPRALARFKQESLAAAQLDHPHIVPVYGVGCERGVHYFAMRYIEGESLAEVIESMKRSPIGGTARHEVQPSPGDLGIGISDFGFAGTSNPKSEIPASKRSGPKSPLDQSDTPAPRAASISTVRSANQHEFFRGVARLAIQAAEALDCAHQNGVLHRDIKPANLLVDDAGNAWVTDFGLARIEGDETLTRTGDLMGTLRYMSPEQALGERALVDQRTDVYSLGATLYELLTLEPVFGHCDRAQLFRRIAETNPQPLRQTDRSIPEELETIVLKCLEKEPGDRYATAAALADDLQRYLADQPLKARRATWIERLRKWSRRHQLAILAGAAVVTLSTIIIATSAVWVTYERGQTATERAAARQHKQINHRHRYVAQFKLAEAAWRRADLAAVKQHLTECLPGAGEEDLRGFEWYWLSRALEMTPSAWRQHTGEAYSAKFTHDGQRLGTCGQDGVRIWSWPAGEQLAHISVDWKRGEGGRHQYDVNNIDFSPDDALLASASDDGTVKIWDTADGRLVRTLAHAGRVIGAAFSPDGSTLACAERHVGSLSSDGKPIELVRLWWTADWTESGRLIGPSGDLQALAWSPDGTLLATAGSEVRVWDVKTSTIRFAERLPIIRSVAFAPSRPVFAVGTADQTLIYSVETDGMRRRQATMTKGAESVVFTRDGWDVLTANRDRVRCWHATTTEPGYEMAEIAAFRDASEFWSATLAPDEDTIVTTSKDGSIKLWADDRLPDRMHFRHRGGLDKWEGAFEFAPDGTRLLYNQNSLKLVDLESGSVIRTLSAPGEVFPQMSLSPDGKWLATRDRQANIDLWDTSQWQRQKLVESAEAAGAFAFIPGSEPALIVMTTKGTRIVGLPAGAPLPVPTELIENADEIVFSPDRRYAAWRARRVQVFGELSDLASGTRLFSGTGYRCVAFSHGTPQFAAGRDDGLIRLWQTADWSDSMLFVENSSPVEGVAISPDGRTIASAATDGSIKLWNAATGRELLTFETRVYHDGTLKFSRDGRALAAGGYRGPNHSGPQIVVFYAGRAK